MTDEVLDLDAEARRPRPQRGGRRWTRGRTTVVAILVALLLAAGAAVVLWPEPAQQPEVLGLQAGLGDTWQGTGPGGEVYAGTPVGDRVAMVMAPDDRFIVRLVDPLSGETAWEYDVAGVAPEQHIALTDLPGASWLAVQTPGELIFLDRDSGEEEGRLEVPVFDSIDFEGADGATYRQVNGSLNVRASDQGTVLVAVMQQEVQQAGSDEFEMLSETNRVSAYRRADLGTPLWTVELADNATFHMPGRVTEVGGHLFVESTSWSQSRAASAHALTYEAALSVDDGSAPDWWPLLGNHYAHAVTLADGVALMADTGPVRAIDIASGEELWRSEPGGWGILSDGEAVYLLPRGGGGEFQRVDARSGRVRWATEVAPGFDAGLYGTHPGTFWGSDLVVRQSHGSDASTLLRFDAHTGREVWRLDLDTASEHVRVLTGEGQLVLMLSAEEAQEDYTTVTTRRALGIDPETGEILWDDTADGELHLSGRYLTTATPEEGLLFFR